MKLPVIKNIVNFIEENDEDYVIEAVEVLEHISQGKGVKEEEIEVISELLSNMYGSIEVSKLIKAGSTQKDALNSFMQRVLGSIEK
ncbi:MAG: hypothetical protein ACJAS4_003231 [Bacteriovoracaceae bacterium]|jgi:hypothetical protein